MKEEQKRESTGEGVQGERALERGCKVWTCLWGLIPLTVGVQQSRVKEKGRWQRESWEESTGEPWSRQQVPEKERRGSRKSRKEAGEGERKTGRGTGRRLGEG